MSQGRNVSTHLSATQTFSMLFRYENEIHDYVLEFGGKERDRFLSEFG